MPEKFFLFQFPSYWYDTVFTGVCRNNHWRPADFASGKPKWRKKDRWLQGFGLTKKKEKIINAVSNFTSFVFDSQTFHVTALPTAQHGQENMSCEKEKYFKFWSYRPKRFIAAFKITGKSLSEALLFAEYGEKMLCTKIVLNVRNNFCTQQTCSPQVWAWNFHVLIL